MKKKVLPVIVNEIPDELKAIRQWVNWKVKKLPVNPSDIKKPASSTDKDTWSSFDQAENNLSKQSILGLGFCLTNYDEYVVIDIDHCINEEKQLSPIALFWAEMFDSYTEISPSGTGIHIFVKGDARNLIGGGKKTKVSDSYSGLGFEIYQTARYFTVTGQPVKSEWNDCGDINYAQNIIELFFYTYFKKGRRSKVWRPVDGKIDDGDRNTTMQQVIGSITSKIVDLIDVNDPTYPEDGLLGLVESIVNHYNEEYFYPPLSNKEISAHLRSADKYLEEKQESYNDAIYADDDFEGNMEDEEDEEGNKESTGKFTEAKKLAQRYIYTKEQGKFYDKIAHTLITKDAVDFAHGNVKFTLKVGGDTKHVDLSKFIKHSKHSTIVDNITWEPGKGRIVEELGKVLYNSYNKIDFSNIPNKASDKDIEIYMKLAKHVIPQPELLEIFLDYLAFTLQHPEQKINYGVLICSEYEGVGKDLLLRPIVDMLGEQCKEITTSMLNSSFNDYLDKTKLLVIQEIHQSVFKDKVALETNLKSILAAPPNKMPINSKGDKPRYVANVCNTIMTSNHDDAIPIQNAQTTRRYLAIHTGCKPFEPEFYEKYVNWLNKKSGLGLIIRHLLDRDVSEFVYSKSPIKTEFLKQMSYNSADTIFHRLNSIFEERSDPFDLELIKVADVTNELEDNKLNPRIVLNALKKLGYHYFGTTSNEVKKKNIKTDSKNNVAKVCNILVHRESKHFDVYAELSGKQIFDLYCKRLTIDSAIGMKEKELLKLIKPETKPKKVVNIRDSKKKPVKKGNSKFTKK